MRDLRADGAAVHGQAHIERHRAGDRGGPAEILRQNQEPQLPLELLEFRAQIRAPSGEAAEKRRERAGGLLSGQAVSAQSRPRNGDAEQPLRAVRGCGRLPGGFVGGSANGDQIDEVSAVHLQRLREAQPAHQLHEGDRQCRPTAGEHRIGHSQLVLLLENSHVPLRSPAQLQASLSGRVSVVRRRHHSDALR